MSEHLDRSDLHEEEFVNPGVSFEHTQADLRIVMGFLIMLAIGIAVVFFVLWGFYAYMQRKQGSGVRPAPYTISRAPQIPAPQLQPDPVADKSRVQFTDRQWLNTYGCVTDFTGVAQQAQSLPYDQSGQRQSSIMQRGACPTGVVRIPIDRAMDLLVQRGLPTGQTENPNPAVGPYPGTARRQTDISKE